MKPFETTERVRWRPVLVPADEQLGSARAIRVPELARLIASLEGAERVDLTAELRTLAKELPPDWRWAFEEFNAVEASMQRELEEVTAERDAAVARAEKAEAEAEACSIESRVAGAPGHGPHSERIQAANARLVAWQSWAADLIRKHGGYNFYAGEDGLTDERGRAALTALVVRQRHLLDECRQELQALFYAGNTRCTKRGAWRTGSLRLLRRLQKFLGVRGEAGG